MERAIHRRILGTASAVLVLALFYLGIDLAAAPPAGSYTIEAELGHAGSGLTSGTDVKVRGVRIGRVESIRYEDATAFATLRLDGEPRLPAPQDIELVVTAKTLLGEKQVEIDFPDERFGQAPFLERDDVVVAARQPTEVQDVLAELEPFLEAIDPQDLAAIVDALGAQEGEGEAIAENIELSSELAAFGARRAEDQLERFRDLADIFAALATTTDDFNRFNAELERWATLLPDRQPAVRANLEALSSFAVGFAEFLEVEEATIDVVMRTGQAVGLVFDRQMEHLGEIVFGLYRYGFKLGRHGGDLNDGTEFGFFRIFLDGSELERQICEGIGPLAELVPACAELQGGAR